MAVLHKANIATKPFHLLTASSGGYSCAFRTMQLEKHMNKFMSPFQLADQLRTLDEAIATLKAEDDYYLNCWVERSAAGGTATGKGKEHSRYAVLRTRKTTFPNGKKSRYIPISQVAEIEAACERGKQIKQLERQRATVIKKLDKIAAIAAQYGLSLPIAG